MAFEGPQVRYARVDDARADDTLKRALELARQIEALLEETRSVATPALGLERATSTRMARAIAASLVDELDAITRGPSEPRIRTGS